MTNASDSAMNLLERAERMMPSADPGLQECWELVTDGIRYGMLTNLADLDDVLLHLRQGRDIIIEELAFEPLGDDLRVRLLDQTACCRPEQMIDLLDTLRSRSVTDQG